LVKAGESSARAENHFKQAIALDPLWADPHSALGYLYFFLGRLGLRPLGQMVGSARAEASKALELLPSDTTSHAVLGAIAASYDYAWKEAHEQFQLATAAVPLPSAVHDLYAVSYLAPLGQFEEAVAQQVTAIAQDPLNMLWRERQCITLLGGAMYERAVAEARKVLEFNNKSFLAHLTIAHAYFFMGKLVEARAPAEEACRRAPWSTSATGFLAGLMARTGEQKRAQQLMDTMRADTPMGRLSYHFMCSEIDVALDWYERAIEDRQPMATECVCARYLEPLRCSPRWPKLARMMNLPLAGDGTVAGGEFRVMSSNDERVR
jgi:tetratricopeptide (TPR) repeat protein